MCKQCHRDRTLTIHRKLGSTVQTTLPNITCNSQPSCLPVCLILNISICLSCLFVYLPNCLSVSDQTPVCVTVCLSRHLSVCVTVYLSRHLSVCSSASLSGHLFVCVTVSLSGHLSVYVTVYLSRHLSVCVSVFVWTPACLCDCFSVWTPIGLSVTLETCWSVWTPVCMCVYSFAYLSLYLSVHLSISLYTSLKSCVYVCALVYLSACLTLIVQLYTLPVLYRALMVLVFRASLNTITVLRWPCSDVGVPHSLSCVPGEIRASLDSPPHTDVRDGGGSVIWDGGGVVVRWPAEPIQHDVNTWEERQTRMCVILCFHQFIFTCQSLV